MSVVDGALAIEPNAEGVVGGFKTMDNSASLAAQLERYTLEHPQEVLLVKVETAGELDEILVFKGFSSSLMRPTAFDPDVPVLSPDATVIQIDRLQGPYQPANPDYLEQGLSLKTFLSRLSTDQQHS